jgi:hypothetical protein
VLGGSDETGLRSATCADCRIPLSRRIEGNEYVYFDAAETVRIR